MSAFRSQSLSNRGWHSATSELRHLWALLAAVSSCRPQLHECSSQDLANAAWNSRKLLACGLLLLGDTPNREPGTLSAPEPLNLAMATWTFAAAGVINQAVFDATGGWKATLSSDHCWFAAQNLSNIRQKPATLKARRVAASEAAAAASALRVEAFDAQGSSNTTQ
ncbi:unnamed protein product [Polarella glacialis]|uniref:Uncharacterized protein n=1 Tax=Polarella glacialis TaxID=89957 RepID=A0A813GPF4_POLGL|nr:unnamed protein product [Polarella glacialis]